MTCADVARSCSSIPKLLSLDMRAGDTCPAGDYCCSLHANNDLATDSCAAWHWLHTSKHLYDLIATMMCRSLSHSLTKTTDYPDFQILPCLHLPLEAASVLAWPGCPLQSYPWLHSRSLQMHMMHSIPLQGEKTPLLRTVLTMTYQKDWTMCHGNQTQCLMIPARLVMLHY